MGNVTTEHPSLLVSNELLEICELHRILCININISALVSYHSDDASLMGKKSQPLKGHITLLAD